MVMGFQSLKFEKFIAEQPADASKVLHWRGASVHSIWRIFHYLYERDYSEDTAMALEAFSKLSNLQQFAGH